MKILLTTLDGTIFPLEVSEDLELINLKALCEQETNIPVHKISLSYDGKPLDGDQKTLASFSIKDNEIIMVQEIRDNVPLIDFSSINMPGTSNRTTNRTSSWQSEAANQFRNMIMADRAHFQIVKQRFPELAHAIEQGDTTRMTELMGSLTSGSRDILPQGPLSTDTFDIEEQQRIEERIRLENVQQNMEHALEYMPEAFGHIVMLYINCNVNGHAVKAFVDSGAQMTIMSAACAERCGIMRLVDKRWAGIAKGVGTQKIVGRVHLAQIQIENTFLPTAFSILEQQPMDMLLGLDLLRRHQCIIDLDRNILKINSANIETRFLSERELPAFARPDEAMEEEPIAVTSSNAPSNASAAASAPAPKSSHPENKIQELVKLGYERTKVIDALNTNNGNIDMAKVFLIAQSFAMPAMKK